MDKQEILTELNKKLNIISAWKPKHHELLSKLTHNDIENETEKSIDSTLALEYIYGCSEVYLTLTDYEIELLDSINKECNTNKLQKILEIIELCNDYINTLEMEEFNHPVSEFYNAKEIMLYSNNNFYNELEKIYTNYPYTINKAHYELTTTESIPELNNVELYFLFESENIENIINYLRKYVITKLQDNANQNNSKNYINTEIMKSLYEYSEIYMYDKDEEDNGIILIDEDEGNEILLDNNFMYMYGNVYKSYIENKMYWSMYRNKTRKLSIYEQKCKKL